MNGADTAWILTSTALVLLMTLPGLALFYAGLVREKNILSVLMHCYAIACVASLLWLIVGYSLAFTNGNDLNDYIGGFSRVFLMGMDRNALYPDLTIPEAAFFTFQMTFAIITPALIVGAYVERIKFGAVLLFSALWILFVYVPVTHWIWGGGWLAQMGIRDFAGGLVVHLTAGISSLVIVAWLGSRKHFPKNLKPPHAPWMVMVGAALLWVGWFGFNGGSALAANGDAAMAILVTHISAATASLVWVFIEWYKFGKASLVGIVTGTIAGLATITPASGFVGPIGGVALGLIGGFLCYVAAVTIREKMQYDDSLDVFAVHGFGGLLGTLLLPFLSEKSLGGVGQADGMTVMGQFWVQIVGSVAVAVWSIVISIAILIIVKKLVGLRVKPEDEQTGLDLSAHGEKGYHL